jgi:transcription elongation factor Elf1
MTQEIPLTNESRYKHNQPREDVVCPFCGEQGFDLQGFPVVDDVEMSLKTCWNCGNQFATERPDNIEVPF